jgi:pimeloyl-ACP methyl ester carboxylesterase
MRAARFGGIERDRLEAVREVIMKTLVAIILLVSLAGTEKPLTAEAQSAATTRAQSAQSIVEAAVTGTSDSAESDNLVTIDRVVPHVSTVPANAGEHVRLFLREVRTSGGKNEKPVVLMIGGATTSAVEVFDLPFQNYSWMDLLARSGFDVFTMDFTGYGLSPRPRMNDPCNAPAADQTFLMPNPIPTGPPCAPSYPHTLTNIQSDWDEMDTVVDYVRRLRQVDKIQLLGWSRAGVRIGGYTARHPEKVEKLFLYDPRYNRTDPLLPPAEPESGVPMRVQPVTDFSGWDAEVGCQSQFTAGIRDVMTSIRRVYDPLGSTWGVAGVRRSPVQGTLFGWNPLVATQIGVPTLVIAGDLDRQTGVGQARNLFADLPVTNKVLIHVACASHQMVWENQHMALLNASTEWLSNGTFNGYTFGRFAVDAAGNVQIESLQP